MRQPVDLKAEAPDAAGELLAFAGTG
jgi:hypothetical protein